MLSIGEFARASGLTAKALRLYDGLGLLTPAEVDESNGYRHYSPGQVGQARLVARLRSAGAPLPRIAAVLGAASPEAAADEVLSYWRQVEADRTAAGEVITSLVVLLRGQDDTMDPTTTPESRLADLIALLDRDLPDADHLARISEARRRARALADLGEQLIDHYVAAAKQGGASWTAIGEALGGSAGEGRHPRAPHAFERFTALNRHSIVLAQEAARTHRHDAIGTEHLLLGLLDETRGLAHQILVAGGRSEEAVRHAISDAMPPRGTAVLTGHIAFRPESTQAIGEALRASTDLGHDFVGTEHLLLGLVRTEESRAAQILRRLGLTSDHLHDVVRAGVTERGAASDT